jgi:hypothetical protein
MQMGLGLSASYGFCRFYGQFEEFLDDYSPRFAISSHCAFLRIG